MARKLVVRRASYLRFDFRDFDVPQVSLAELQVIGLALLAVADPEAGSAEREAAARLAATLEQIAQVTQTNKAATRARSRPTPQLRRTLVQSAAALHSMVRAQQRAAPPAGRAAELKKVMALIATLERPAQQRNRSLCDRVTVVQKVLEEEPHTAALVRRYVAPAMLESVFAARDALLVFGKERRRRPRVTALTFYVQLLRTRITEYTFSVLGTTDVEVPATRARAANLLQILLDVRRDRSRRRARLQRNERARAAKAPATPVAPAKPASPPTKAPAPRKGRPR